MQQVVVDAVKRKELHIEICHFVIVRFCEKFLYSKKRRAKGFPDNVGQVFLQIGRRAFVVKNNRAIL